MRRTLVVWFVCAIGACSSGGTSPEAVLAPDAGMAAVPPPDSVPAPDAGVAAVPPDGDAGVPPKAASLVVSAATSLSFAQGEAVDLPVMIARDGIGGVVHVDATGLPSGVSVTAVDVAAGATDAILKLTATAAASIGSSSINVVATGPADADSHVVTGSAKTDLALAGAHGSHDLVFGGGDAKVTVYPRVIRIQPDGNIVALAGNVSRLLADGSDDPAFTRWSLPNGYTAYGMTLQPDGKIVVVGAAYNAGAAANDLFVARLTSAGALDATFGTSGIVLTDVTGSVTGYDVAVQTDGKIAVAGATFISGMGFEIVLARYSATGALDATFGSAGVVTTNYLSNAIAWGMAIQSDGKILVAGDGNTQTIVARFDTAGVLDPTYGTAGRAIQRAGRLSAIVLQSDGKAIVAGSNGRPDTAFDYEDMLVMRYDTAGALDTTFNAPNGYLTRDIAGRVDVARALAIQPDGKIVVAGEGMIVTSVVVNGGTTTTTYGYASALLRFNADGTTDAKLGTNGYVKEIPGQAFKTVALQKDGHIVAGGDPGIVRYWP